jgi:hypothetical protein
MFMAGLLAGGLPQLAPEVAHPVMHGLFAVVARFYVFYLRHGRKEARTSRGRRWQRLIPCPPFNRPASIDCEGTVAARPAPVLAFLAAVTRHIGPIPTKSPAERHPSSAWLTAPARTHESQFPAVKETPAPSVDCSLSEPCLARIPGHCDAVRAGGVDSLSTHENGGLDMSSNSLCSVVLVPGSGAVSRDLVDLFADQCTEQLTLIRDPTVLVRPILLYFAEFWGTGVVA